MNGIPSRRQFVGKSIRAGVGFGFLGQLPRVAAADAALDPAVVALGSEIEPLVRLLEDTPRDRLVEEVAKRISRGRVSYRELLTALLLAGVRNIQPRPAVGFKFHAVLVVHSAHLASLSGPESDRWLPILWAVDDFKKSQARDVEEGDWTMSPVAEHLVPSAAQAREAFITAMDRWDEEAADAAVVGLSRSAGADEIFDLFVPYAARDLRSIGHKAIYLANAWRTLQVMGWHHAEPVLRSLAYALLNRGGDTNPAENDHATDRPWRRNEALAADIVPQWQDGTILHSATAELMATMREGTADQASDAVAAAFQKGLAPQSVIDALFTGSAELMLRQPAIPALHAVTTTNAMHYLFRTCGDDATRRRLLLQNAAFLPMFREIMEGRGNIREVRLDTLEAEGVDAAATPVDLLAGGDLFAMARKVLGFTTDGDRAREVIAEVRRRIFLQGRDAHHYKFSTAVLEDYTHVSPEWRARLLAAVTQYLPSGGENPLVKRVRDALSG